MEAPEHNIIIPSFLHISHYPMLTGFVVSLPRDWDASVSQCWAHVKLSPINFYGTARRERKTTTSWRSGSKDPTLDLLVAIYHIAPN